MSCSLIDKAPDDKCVVTSGGFEDATNVHFSRADLDVNDLKAIHKKADTHLLLHCKHSKHTSQILLWYGVGILMYF